MKPRLAMIGLLACLAACSGGQDDNNDPADVDESPPPLGSHGRARHVDHARDALRPLSRHLPRPPDPTDETGTEAYHAPPDAAAMQMISSGYDPNQAGDDDSGSDSNDGKHFVVPDTQVSYGKQGQGSH
ncbi:hypothetical protein MSKU15_3168 [Komagataeibacter diospyri]|uniref:Uncharacterized protein n=2 Tax=Komagataeibacter diospyri TaxID=1932662 RepID=A0A4P5NYB9_9PROT|nr:hypothetical protein MSKU9_2836 [Komagataeibacter diospyri]GCE91567.1 hypothetical protein MSKU15_3168 [Komagataeibacter diospyri]